MANILKDGKTYTDTRGVVYTNPYMIINNTIGTNSPTISFQFSIAIYATSDAKDAGYSPIYTKTFQMSLDNINTYLVTPKPASSMESPLAFARKNVYIYLGTELPPADTITWSDWKSDEEGGVPRILKI